MNRRYKRNEKKERVPSLNSLLLLLLLNFPLLPTSIKLRPVSSLPTLIPTHSSSLLLFGTGGRDFHRKKRYLLLLLQKPTTTLPFIGGGEDVLVVGEERRDGMDSIPSGGTRTEE